MNDDFEVFDEEVVDERTFDQVELARSRLIYAPKTRLRFTPNALHEAVGYMSKGQLVVGASLSGIGKSTLVNSTVNDLVEAGFRVALLPLEKTPEEVRLELACLRADVDKKIAYANSWTEYPNGSQMLYSVDAELCEQEENEKWRDNLLVLPYRYIDSANLAKAAREAGAFMADIFIVDHLDHIDQSANAWGEAGKLAQICKQVAEEWGYTTWALKQINNEQVKKASRIMRYMPPSLHQLQGGGLTGQVANVVFGIYRPVGAHLIGEAGKQKLRAFNNWEIEPNEVLMPNTMGVNVLKHRTDGSMEGRKALLQVRHGRVTDKGEQYDDRFNREIPSAERSERPAFGFSEND